MSLMNYPAVSSLRLQIELVRWAPQIFNVRQPDQGRVNAASTLTNLIEPFRGGGNKVRSLASNKGIRAFQAAEPRPPPWAFI